jgi:hypothetical protein
MDHTNGDGHSGQFQHRIISAKGAPPAAGAGAVSSPFAMGQQIAKAAGIDLTQEPEPRSAAASPTAGKPNAHNWNGGRYPPKSRQGQTADAPAAGRAASLVDRAKQTLDACGPLSVEKLAEGLGADLDKVRTLVRNGVAHGYWQRGKDAEGNKVIELCVAAPSKAPPKKGERGFKAWLTRQGQTSEAAPRRSRKAGAKKKPAKKASKPAAKASKPAKRPYTRRTPIKAPVKTVSLTIEQMNARARELATRPRGDLPALSCGLFNTGHLHIEVGDRSLVLDRGQARELVAYLDKIAAAIQE